MPGRQEQCNLEWEKVPYRACHPESPDTDGLRRVWTLDTRFVWASWSTMLQVQCHTGLRKHLREFHTGGETRSSTFTVLPWLSPRNLSPSRFHQCLLFSDKLKLLSQFHWLGVSLDYQALVVAPGPANCRGAVSGKWNMALLDWCLCFHGSKIWWSSRKNVDKIFPKL